MNVAKLKEKARQLEAKTPDKAIETYVQILEGLEGTPELEAELPLFNKVGDLYQKIGKTPEAADIWERAMTRYTEGGFANNAIALCNKILRVAPGRTHIYLKLAQLMVQRGLVSEAKQHFLEYADRMQQAGKLEQAFKALKEFADLSPNNSEIRVMLAEQLKSAARTDEAREQLAKLYAEAQASGDQRRSRATLTQIKAIDPHYDPEQDPKAKVPPKSQKSHDLIFLDVEDAPAPATARAAPPAAKPAPPPPEAPPAAKPPARPSVAKPAPRSSVATPKPRPSVSTPAPAPPPPPEPEPVADLGIERASVEFDTSGVGGGVVEGLDTGMAGAGVAPPEEPPSLEAPPEPVAAAPDADLPILDVPQDALGGDASLTLEVPELDLGALGEPAGAGAGLDLELGAGAESLVPAGPPDVRALEASVADGPDDPARHRALAEALIETGERERGLEELDIAMGLWEVREEWQTAQDLADEILRLDSNSVRHHQKRVEYAFRLGDKPNLVNAYLELADAFFRSGAMDRARTVYQRVLEHDAANQRALMALNTLEPAAPEPPAAVAAAGPAKPPAAGGDFVDLGAFILDDEGPKDTRLRVQDEEPTGDEERDFKDMLDQFKKGIDATLGEEDVQAHYDLGVAFKEMGLLDEAIAEFQKALRSPDMRIRTSEALGACFFEKGQPAVAATVLRRAVEQDSGGDESKIGLLYWLGRCEEEEGKMAEALAYYQRVFAVDIRFQDVSDRVKALAKAGR